MKTVFVFFKIAGVMFLVLVVAKLLGVAGDYEKSISVNIQSNLGKTAMDLGFSALVLGMIVLPIWYFGDKDDTEARARELPLLKTSKKKDELDLSVERRLIHLEEKAKNLQFFNTVIVAGLFFLLLAQWLKEK